MDEASYVDPKYVAQMSFSVDGGESKYVALLLNDYADSTVLIVNL